MQPSEDFSLIPGRRIDDYRNSAQRFIKLYGLGAAGAQIAQQVSKRGRPNVEIRTGEKPVGWDEIAGRTPDPDTNMIVIVCAQGDEGLFRPAPERPDSLVTFVLLQNSSNVMVVGDESMSYARGCSDLFVTTSDRDYVADLIDNLAS